MVKTITDEKSIDEVLESANINFIAEQSELISQTGITSKTHKMIFRSDNNTELGIVGKKYQPIQNSNAFAVADVLNEQEGTVYDKISSFDNGGTNIITLKYPKTTLINVNDEVQSKINIVNGFDGKTALRVDFMVERLVCTNGLRAVVPAENSIKLKHTDKIESKYNQALMIIAKGINFFDEFGIKAKELTEKSVDALMVDRFLEEMFGTSKRSETNKDQVKELFQYGKGNNGDTAWDLYNGLTEYYDHYYGKEENRIETNLNGRGIAVKEKAWKLCCSM